MKYIKDKLQFPETCQFARRLPFPLTENNYQVECLSCNELYAINLRNGSLQEQYSSKGELNLTCACGRLINFKKALELEFEKRLVLKAICCPELFKRMIEHEFGLLTDRRVFLEELSVLIDEMFLDIEKGGRKTNQ